MRTVGVCVCGVRSARSDRRTPTRPALVRLRCTSGCAPPTVHSELISCHSPLSVSLPNCAFALQAESLLPPASSIDRHLVRDTLARDRLDRQPTLDTPVAPRQRDSSVKAVLSRSVINAISERRRSRRGLSAEAPSQSATSQRWKKVGACMHAITTMQLLLALARLVRPRASFESVVAGREGKLSACMRMDGWAGRWNRFNPSQEAEARGIQLNGTTADESDKHGVSAIALQLSGVQKVGPVGCAALLHDAPPL